MMISMVVGYGLLFVGIGLFIQGWRELHRAHKDKRLATGGLYGVVRHPQYVGLFGEGVVHWLTVFSIGLFPLIVIAYVLLARSEEPRMVTAFGEAYVPINGGSRCSCRNGATGGSLSRVREFPARASRRGPLSACGAIILCRR